MMVSLLLGNLLILNLRGDELTKRVLCVSVSGFWHLLDCVPFKNVVSVLIRVVVLFLELLEPRLGGVMQVTGVVARGGPRVFLLEHFLLVDKVFVDLSIVLD